MKPIPRIKAKVTSSKWPYKQDHGKVILIPETLKADFINYGYGEIVKEDPREYETPEIKADKKVRTVRRKKTK